MSIQAVAWVLEHSEATLADRLVLIAIANHADANGWNAWPSVPQIAREARVDRATVFRAIETLEFLGELNVKRHPGRVSTYVISGGRGSQDATGTGVADCDRGVANDQQRGRNLRPEPSLTVNQPRGAPEFVPRCPVCDLLKFDCQCENPTSKEKAKANLRAIRKKEEPA